MWGLFDEAGIFAGACRHGPVLWVIDMVCSGELWVSFILFLRVSRLMNAIELNTLLL
jgi:hypothetical protein